VCDERKGKGLALEAGGVVRERGEALRENVAGEHVAGQQEEAAGVAGEEDRSGMAGCGLAERLGVVSFSKMDAGTCACRRGETYW
jgi:hypothetical protein